MYVNEILLDALDFKLFIFIIFTNHLVKLTVLRTTGLNVVPMFG